jgi:hypothetical protein
MLDRVGASAQDADYVVHTGALVVLFAHLIACCTCFSHRSSSERVKYDIIFINPVMAKM